MPPSPSELKGKGKAEEAMTEEERLAKEAKQRSFERSLAGPSVGKAGERRDPFCRGKLMGSGLMRDQTGV
jgi:DNA polymerase kappa